jgi:tetratricopeptide (TPR) repeat protein
MSVRDFAGHTGLSTTAITDLEARGERARPRYATQQILDTVLANAPDHARERFGILLATPGAERSPAMIFTDAAVDGVDSEVTVGLDRLAEEVSATDRRTVLATSLTAPFAAVLAEPGVRVGVEDARRIRQVVPELYRMDNANGGEAVMRAATWCLRRVETLLEVADFGEPTGRELHGAYGQLAEMVGWLCFDARQHDRARFCYGEALRAARLADDLDLEVLVLSSSSTLARYRGRPREAVGLIQLAQRRAAGWAPVRLSALLSAKEAVCHAQLGDGVESRRAMHRADNAFTPEANESDPAWIWLFDAAELNARRATAAEYLDQPAQAAEHMRAAVAGLDPRLQRNRSFYTARLGLSLLASGDRAQACEVIAPALSEFTDVQSGRARARLTEFCGAIAHAPSPPARDLIEQAHHLNLVKAG